MGKFDFDELLGELCESNQNAPKEPGFDAAEPVAPDDAQPSSRAVVTPARAGGEPPEGASHADGKPRPPHRSADGPARAADTQRGANKADPARVLPDDALSNLYAPPKRTSGPTLDLGQKLLSKEVIKPDQLANAIRVMKETPGKRLADILLEMGVDETEVQQAVAEIAGLPFERIDFEDEGAVDQALLKRIGIEYCKVNFVLPLRREGRRAVVGSPRPDDVFRLDEVRRKLGLLSVKHVLVTTYDIRGVIEAATEGESTTYDVDNILADVAEDDVEVVKDEIDDSDFAEEAESSPVVRYVNHIIQTALKEGASDIHIEPGEKKLKVRFRIDGLLFEMMNPPFRMHAALTSRVKIMANLDIAERRLPQDGRIRATVLGRKLDLRVSTLPTAHGEKVVMRILDNRSIEVSLDQLGFAENTLDLWKGQIRQPHGIILVTGPTGSGKTTTLYASLGQMDMVRLNVSTVEDPVEYNLAGITQTQTHEKIGMTFAKALKSLLRQDPDVIMVGEIRDLDTATTAIQAALTGHLVLSTLHTNDAPASVTRMINIGIEPFLIGAALNGVLAQRLVRRNCENCKVDQPVNPEVQEYLVMHGIESTTLPHGTGCHKCRETGYGGRIGIYEMLVFDDFLRDAVARNPNVTEFRRTCTERGMVTLREDGFKKVGQGRTTVEEVLRVTEATI